MKKAILVLMIVALMGLSACVTNTHIIGSGPQGGYVQTKQQWYAIWGLVPLGEADTNKMAGQAENYEIKTYYGFVDVVISFFLGPLSLASRTVAVIK